MQKTTILWVDDEIDLLKSHVLFLNEKGFEVITAVSGNDALELIGKYNFDIVFLDENMPGMSGLEVLNVIKNTHPNIPVVMITKSEEETIMEDAIGNKIADYLIKPVNPNQILLSIKKNLDNKKLINEKTTISFQQELRNITLALSDVRDFDDWVELYKKIVYWDLELQKSKDTSLQDIIRLQKNEANAQFSKFIQKDYAKWLVTQTKDTPLMSHTIFKNKVSPLLDKDRPVFLLLIDNLRYDQWKVLQPIIDELYYTENEQVYCSILPTVTQYARNSFFAGLMPSEIRKYYSQFWSDNDDDEMGKNDHEADLLEIQLKRLSKNIKFSYYKVLNYSFGKKLSESLSNLMSNKLNVIVYNFVDMLSHARTEMDVIKELASDESAYRSLTLSWFQHSPLFEIIKFLSEKNITLLITTDHGSVHVDTPSKVIGTKEITTNLRYKVGKTLQYNPKDVYEVRNPSEIFLPKDSIASTYIFAKEDRFFAYPNNYNHYVNYYRNTFQHGGISMEEMLIPFVTLQPKMK
ncbi:MAG: bifunctional response regulator/alkaline phosphatase family protein [Bacteroidota bacterium]|nr:bifunctional response regulator/alkaline phosphatase family protein [Bacteroidota bacterium]